MIDPTEHNPGPTERPPDSRTEAYAHPTSAVPDVAFIGPYRILEALGRGGQGAVYLAEDSRLKRRVAIKVLIGHSATHPDALMRFRREAEAAARIDHPGVCQVFETGEWKGEPYIVMRYVPGETLAKRLVLTRENSSTARAAHLTGIRPLGPVTDTGRNRAAATTLEGREAVMRSVRFVELAAEAMQAAHEAGVIHRDLKPANLMIGADGAPVVFDFGLARDLYSEGAETIAGEFFGTIAYMSPEQLLANRVRLDARTDVWSLGVVLYECVTLRRPFIHPTAEGLQIAIQAIEPPDARSINPAVPRDLSVVLATVLDKNRDRRYQSARDFAEDLRRVQQHLPILARPAGFATKLRRWVERNTAVALSLGAAFLILLLALAVTWVLLGRVGDEKAEYDRLSDVPLLARLIADAGELPPATPAGAAALRAWTSRAEALVGRLPMHREIAAALGAEAAVEFKRSTYRKLIADLESFAGGSPLPDNLPGVRRRLHFAENVRRRTIDDRTEAWRAAIEEIADPARCPKYAGLRTPPQEGLIPIGADAETGLYRFLHVESDALGLEVTEEILAGLRTDPRAQPDRGIILILIPGGTFMQGARPPAEMDEEYLDKTGKHPPNVDLDVHPEEQPPHQRAVEAFLISRDEMTQAQWLRLTGVNPSVHSVGATVSDRKIEPTNPVENIGRDFAKRALADAASLRLPSETEWEYAARAGTSTKWLSGWNAAEMLPYANLREDPNNVSKEGAWVDGFSRHAPVGSFKPNAFGLRDVVGNVAEWCDGDLAPYPGYVRPADLVGSDCFADSALNAVWRGGGFDQYPHGARMWARGRFAPTYSASVVGVRPARTLTR